MVELRLELNPLWVASAIVVVICSVILVVVLYLAQKKDEAATEKEKRLRKRSALQARDKKRKKIAGNQPVEMPAIEGKGTITAHTLQGDKVEVEVGELRSVTVGQLAGLVADNLRVNVESVESLSFEKTALCRSCTLAKAGVGNGASVFVEYRDGSSAILSDAVRKAPRGCVSLLHSVAAWQGAAGLREVEAEWSEFCSSGATTLPGGRKMMDCCPHCKLPRTGTRFVPDIAVDQVVAGSGAPLEIHLHLERKVRQLALDPARVPRTDGLLRAEFTQTALPTAPAAVPGKLAYCSGCGSDDSRICFKWIPVKASAWPPAAAGVLRFTLNEAALPLASSTPGASKRLSTTTWSVSCA